MIKPTKNPTNFSGGSVNKNQIAEKYDKPVEEFLTRLDGRIEWLCKHGMGHTVWFPKESSEVHGCDGCCKELKEVSK